MKNYVENKNVKNKHVKNENNNKQNCHLQMVSRPR